MTYTVTLNEQQLNELMTVTEVVWEMKRSGPDGIKLGKRALETFETEYLTSILEQIAANEFEVNHKQKNTFRWLIDQIEYVGLDPQEYPMVQRVLNTCEAAATGELAWRAYAKSNSIVFNQLFQSA